MRYVLASGSPRRKELLSKIISKYEVIVSDVCEKTDKTAPDEVVCELSAIKAQAVFNDLSECNEAVCVIGSDTVVSIDDTILLKPVDREDAFCMLSKLSGRNHQVFTGVTVIVKKNGLTTKKTFATKTDVYVESMTKEEIDEYIATNEPMDKAGAYGIQGYFAKYVTKIDGDYNNVVGLPVNALWKCLKEMI